MNKQINNALRATIGKLQDDGVLPLCALPTITVERPKDVAHGDWTTNIGFVLAGPCQLAPHDIAQKISEALAIPGVAESAPAGGYINFTVTREAHQEQMHDIVERGDTFGCSTVHADKKVLVEHSSPNLFKPFHIGHLVNNTIGESITRLMRFSGAEVQVIAFPSDVSLGIAKAVWAIRQKDPTFLARDDKSTHEKMVFMGQCYAYGTQQYDADEHIKNDIRTINKAIYAGEKGSVVDVYHHGKELNLAYFVDITTRLGSTFDGYIFEGEAGQKGQDIVRENIGTVFQESDGAVIYEGEQEGLHTRVFINADGLPTYEAKDIGLLHEKFARYNPDLSLFVTDYEQREYFKVVLAAAGKINPLWRERSHHIPHGRLGFVGGKISSRLGNVPLAEDVLATIHDTVKAKIAESEHAKVPLSEEILDAIAIGAIKFAILKGSIGKNATFDETTSLSFEGDSGPYLQYTYARIQSVLAKAHDADIAPSLDQPCDDTVILERMLEQFPEKVEFAISGYAPHVIAAYLLDLARMFNAYYAKTQIVSHDSHAPYRLAVATATGHVLKNGLHLLGVKTVEKM